MAAPTNVKEFYEQALAGLDVDQAEEAFSDAQAEERTAADEAKEALKALAKLDDDIAKTRTAIAKATMPSEVAALAEDLRLHLIDQRHLRADLLVKEDKAHAKALALADARSELERVRSARAATRAIVDDETERRARLDAWKSAAAVPPVSDLAGGANGVLSATLTAQEATDLEDETKAGTVAEAKPFAAAKARVEGDVPAELMARGQERIGYQVNRRKRRADLLGTAEAEDAARRESIAGPAAKVANKRAAFEAAEAALGALVNGGAERLDQNKALLVAIVATPRLDDDVADRITDTGIVDAGKEGVTAEKTFQDAVEDLEAKQNALARRTLELVAADVDILDAADPEDELDDDGLWDTLKGEVDAAQAALPGAPGAADRAKLDTWEVAVPDFVWANLVQLEGARRALTEIKDTDAAAVAAAVDTAEGELLTALRESDKAKRTESYLAGETAAASDAATRFVATFGQRVAGAARGDA